jgi:Acetyltransferase (GNAT) domain
MGLSIRQATAEDLPAAVRLFEIRDGHSYEPELIVHKVGRFNPERTLAWMAYDGSDPVGMTMMLLRELNIDGEKFRAGYWANLYIRPEYRRYLLYPRLTLAMTGALRNNDLAILYTAVRNTDVAQAHVKLGFSKIGELAVRAKPLRPVRLFMRAKAWDASDRFASIPDYMFRGLLKMRSPNGKDLQVCEMTVSENLAEFASLLDQTRCRVRQVWSHNRLKDRYASNRDGEPYYLLGVRRQGMLVAAALWRAAVRGNKVRAGIWMDVAFRDDEEYVARKVMAAAEWCALEKSCDVMLHLDGLNEVGGIIQKSGYCFSPEWYTVLLWPAQVAKNGQLANLGSWRYGFSEHDTF